LSSLLKTHGPKNKKESLACTNVLILKFEGM